MVSKRLLDYLVVEQLVVRFVIQDGPSPHPPQIDPGVPGFVGPSGPGNVIGPWLHAQLPSEPRHPKSFPQRTYTPRVHDTIQTTRLNIHPLPPAHPTSYFAEKHQQTTSPAKMPSVMRAVGKSPHPPTPTPN
jgi:hypothetical protein